MKAVVLEMPDHWRRERERWGGARRDEVWDGVLHMVLFPTSTQQDLLGGLIAFLLYN